MSRVAVIGLGEMGRRIAARLHAAGHELVVWNRTEARAAELVEAGARVATTPAEAARDADFVITMVSDPGALRDVSEGADGIAAGVGSAATVLEMSTVGPGAVARLRTALPGETALVDAPVLGSVSEAESGTLTIFVGGEAHDVARVEPLLTALGRPLHVGELGMGAAAKLVANSTLFAVLAGLGEALALAGALGLSRESAFEVLAATPLAQQAERRRESFQRDAYPPRFSLALARKDAALVEEAAERARVDLRLAAAASSWLVDAEQAGLGDLDYSALLAHINARA